MLNCMNAYTKRIMESGNCEVIYQPEKVVRLVKVMHLETGFYFSASNGSTGLQDLITG